MSQYIEINECDIGTPDIYRFPQVDGLSMGPPGFGVSQLDIDIVFDVRW